MFEVSFRGRQRFLDRSTAWVRSNDKDRAENFSKDSLEYIFAEIALSLDESVRSFDRVLVEVLSQKGLMDPDIYY